MTQKERTRFIILLVLLVLIVGLAFLVNVYQRRSEVGADILGEMQNQAVATYKTDDGLELTNLSTISKIRVSSGNNRLTALYKLGKRKDQNGLFDIQFYNTDSGELVATVPKVKGQQGTFRLRANSIPNGIYDISAKPLGYLSQAKRSISYSNGSPVAIEYDKVFAWGDIDVSHGGKGDNVINNADWSQLILAWGSDNAQAVARADYNSDGVVNNVDASVMLANWGPPGELFEVSDTTEELAAPPEEFE